MIRIVLADDQRLFVESLARVIVMLAPDIEIAGIAFEAHEAISLVRNHRPDLLLMDIRMPGMNGIDAARRVHAEFPHVKIMMLTMFDDYDYIREALKLGADGYLLKNVSPEEVIASIRAVVHGAVQMSPLVARSLVDQYGVPADDGEVTTPGGYVFPRWYEKLNPRERQVSILLVSGKTNKEISDEVFLAEQTVKNYISNIYRKLNVENRVAFVKLVMQSGWPMHIPTDRAAQ